MPFTTSIGQTTCPSSNGAFKAMQSTTETLKEAKTTLSTQNTNQPDFGKGKSQRQLFKISTDNKENEGRNIDPVEIEAYRKLCEDFEAPSLERLGGINNN